jgi:hypothetical protein
MNDCPQYVLLEWVYNFAIIAEWDLKNPRMPIHRVGSIEH